MGWQAEAAPDYGTSRGAARGGGVRIGSWSCENAVAWRSDRMDHLFDCAFRCEDRYARWLSVDLRETIPVVPELRGFHTARVRLGADCNPPTAGLPSAAEARVHGGHRRCAADADILSGCSCSGLTNTDSLPLLRYSASRSIPR